MHVDETGDGPATLFLHGAGVAGWMWRPTLDALGGRVRAIVPDLPGHGRSTGQPYRSHDQTLEALVGVLQRHCPSGVVVAGFSLGAQLAVLLAAGRPDLVHGVVVVSALNRPAPLASATRSLLSATAPLARQGWFARLQARQLGIPDGLLPEYVRDSAAVTRETLLAAVEHNSRFSPPPRWSDFPGRAVVLVGEREPAVMRESAERTHAALPASRLEVVAGCGHDIPFRRPAAVADSILDLTRPQPSG